MLRNWWLWFGRTVVSGKRGSREAARRKPSAALRLEPLETRLAPVVGAFSIPDPVMPGRGYDGVVKIPVGAGNGTGSLLSVVTAGSRHILTAAHVVDDSPKDG